MKKFLLSIILGLICSLTAVAQSFITQHGDTVMVNVSGLGGNTSIYNMVKSATAGNIYLKWQVVAHDIPATWTWGGFCDNISCFSDSAILNGEIQVTDAYGSANWGDFHCIFNGDNAPVNSKAWLTVHAEDTVANYSRTLTFIATKWATSVSSVAKGSGDLVLYPNPARGHLNTVFDATMDVKNIVVLNMIGKAVSVYKVNGGSAKLSLEDLPAGIYFVRLLNSRGQIVATRKFTHQ